MCGYCRWSWSLGIVGWRFAYPTYGLGQYRKARDSMVAYRAGDDNGKIVEGSIAGENYNKRRGIYTKIHLSILR